MEDPRRYPRNWEIVKDWQQELPYSPLRVQDYSNQCWNLSMTECVRDMAYFEKNHLPEDLSNSDMRDWLPHLSTYFDMEGNPPAHAVNPDVWPAYDVSNGCPASMLEVSQYLKTFGTPFKLDYRYEQPILGNNFSMFSMKNFHAIRKSSGQRVFIDTFRFLDSESVIPIIKEKHTAVGILYSSYKGFLGYKYYKPLSPNPPIDETTLRPYDPDHMVYIVGYGFDNIEEEKTECYLIKNTWSDEWGFNGLAMVPVQLFTLVGYPKGVNVCSSSTVVNVI